MGEPQACEMGTFKIANKLNIEDRHLGSAADSDAEETGSKRIRILDCIQHTSNTFKCH